MGGPRHGEMCELAVKGFMGWTVFILECWAKTYDIFIWFEFLENLDRWFVPCNKQVNESLIASLPILWFPFAGFV